MKFIVTVIKGGAQYRRYGPNEIAVRVEVSDHYLTRDVMPEWMVAKCRAMAQAATEFWYQPGELPHWYVFSERHHTINGFTVTFKAERPYDD